MQQDGSRSEEKQLGLFFIPLLVYLKLCQSWSQANYVVSNLEHENMEWAI
jgi:hypothetical protein